MTVITNSSHSVPTQWSSGVDSREPRRCRPPRGQPSARPKSDTSTSGLALGTGPLAAPPSASPSTRSPRPRRRTGSAVAEQCCRSGPRRSDSGHRPTARRHAADASCRDDLLAAPDAEQVGGTAAEPTGKATAAPVRLVGTVGAATSASAAHRGLRDRWCWQRVDLLSSGDGRRTGIDVDLVTLSSAAGGAAGPDTLADPPGPGPEPPATAVERTGRLDWRTEVTGRPSPTGSCSPGHGPVASDDLGRSGSGNLDAGQRLRQRLADRPRRAWRGRHRRHHVDATALRVGRPGSVGHRGADLPGPRAPRPRSRSSVHAAALGRPRSRPIEAVDPDRPVSGSSVSDTPLRRARPGRTGPRRRAGVAPFAGLAGRRGDRSGGIRGRWPQVGVLWRSPRGRTGVPRGQVARQSRQRRAVRCCGRVHRGPAVPHDFQVDFNWVEWSRVAPVGRRAPPCCWPRPWSSTAARRSGGGRKSVRERMPPRATARRLAQIRRPIRWPTGATANEGARASSPARECRPSGRRPPRRPHRVHRGLDV